MNKKMNFFVFTLGLSLSFNILADILQQGVSAVTNTANTELGNTASAVGQQVNQTVSQVPQQMPILQAPAAVPTQNVEKPSLQQQMLDRASSNETQQQNQNTNQLQSVLQSGQIQPSQMQTADNQSDNANQLSGNQTQESSQIKPTAGIQPSQLVTTPAELLPHYCPLAKELYRVGNTWMVKKIWKDDNVSIVKEIGTFVGAQWVGVKYGSIICLYHGKNAFDFPIALRQINAELIPEPQTSNWSAIVTNYKLCKSTNVKDCPYFVKPEETTQNAYKDIEYNPSKQNDLTQ